MADDDEAHETHRAKKNRFCLSHSKSMKKFLLLGSGELGREFTIAAKRAGQYVIACDKYDNAPAMQVADECEVFSMLDGDALSAVVARHRPDLIVPEIEAIRTERLFDFEEEGIRVVPSARAVNYTMNRRAIRDLASRELGLRTARYFYAKTFDEFKRAADEIGFPCVVKPLMSSSGHGQSYVHDDDELQEAFRDAMEEGRGDVREVIIEEFIDFDSEFTLLTVTQQHGPTLFCPPIGHVQKGGDYRESWMPYAISEDALKVAQHMADEVTRALTGYGIWGVEFFLTRQGEVIFSELSPRPHDTGMVTLSHCTNLSEFELHFRAVMGLNIPAIHLEHSGASAVVLSPVESNQPLDYNLADVCREDHARVRIFGKPEAHVGRRMGVVTCYDKVGCDMTALRDKTKRLAKTVLGTDPYMKK
nr:formate-dependent phosphoribosylglycinamide formyltransferase [Hallella multisaccharivorax]